MRLRAGWAALALTVCALGPGLAAPTAACAGEAPRAVLVVDTGSEVLRYCVNLGRESISGTDLIVQASRQHGLSYRFGFGGGAVCMLAGVGVSGDDCFEKYPDFWGYWRGQDGGGWSWSSTGAASTTVSDGDVEGWSWGSGTDGSSHRPPPPTEFEDVCTPIHQPKPKPEDEDRHGSGERSQGASDSTPPAGSTSSDPAEETTLTESRNKGDDGARGAGRSHKPRAPDREEAGESGIVTPSNPDPSPSPRAIASASRSGSAPPAAGLVALAVAVLLVTCGVAIRARAQSPREP